MKFNKPLGIDPIVNPILGYIPIPTDYLNFANQLKSIEDNINKYWPQDNSWDDLYEINEEEEEIKIKFENKKENVKEDKKELNEKFNVNNILDEYNIVLTKVK